MCFLFNVSRSSYYEYLRMKVGKRTSWNQCLLEEIRACFVESKQTYGSPRISNYLRKKGIQTSEVTVAKLMRKNQIRSISKKKFVVTTNSKHDYPISNNLLDRKFTVEKPSSAWISDITYVRTQEGWVYLTTVIDLFDRKVIGRSVSNRMDVNSTVITAFKDALTKRTMFSNTIFHSDRGVQYASKEFRDLLNKHTNAQSMSRRANCWDNAVAESFFSSFKKECVRKTIFYSKEIAKKEILGYIDNWYNTKRIHSSLGYLSPLEFEIKHRIKNVA